MDKQLRKGLLEYCVLAVIEKEDSYGYKMIEGISKYLNRRCIQFCDGWKKPAGCGRIIRSITIGYENTSTSRKREERF